MKENHMAAAGLLLAAADATWRCEAAKVLNRAGDDPLLPELPAARGEPGTLLRTAYEARERAYNKLQRIRTSA